MALRYNHNSMYVGVVAHRYQNTFEDLCGSCGTPLLTHNIDYVCGSCDTLLSTLQLPQTQFEFLQNYTNPSFGSIAEYNATNYV